MKLIKVTLTILTAGVALSACVQQQELIPMTGQSPQQYNKDREICIAEVQRQGTSVGAPSESDLFLMCMKAKGYKPSEKL